MRQRYEQGIARKELVADDPGHPEPLGRGAGGRLRDAVVAAQPRRPAKIPAAAAGRALIVTRNHQPPRSQRSAETDARRLWTGSRRTGGAPAPGSARKERA